MTTVGSSIFPIILCAFGIAILVWFVIQSENKKDKEIEASGVEVEAIVVKNDRRPFRRKEIRYHTYVKYYVEELGMYRTAIINYGGGIPVGRKLRIKYIPGQYDRIFVSQDLYSL